jgi:SAM-dependent methyltransferase
MKLNLGCSDRFKPGYVNVDLIPPSHVSPGDLQQYFQQADLSQPWPWAASSIEEIVADDIIEHLPNKIFTMNEIHRVLIPGGLAHIFVPTTDGRGAWQDPTHCSWWNRNSFLYYTENDPHYTRFHEAYGIRGCFRVVKEEMSEYPGFVSKLSIVLKAVK